ncbi:MAG TPA: PD-(D/E)XK nuclease family protein, partial [Gaiellaceae bacterium]|nr:PD-(D/E)XK nuclease family protein [Gaiellaceae bacterium]
ARTRRFEIVFILGLEEGSLPRRDRPSAFLDDDRRRALGRRLERPDSVSRDRYLFYTACTRATQRLYLVREAASDDGGERESSPFWDEVKAVFDPEELDRWTRRRALSDLTWPIDSAPSDRERLRSLAELSVDPATQAGAIALADANDWSRRLRRARHAFERRTRLRNPALLAEFGARRTFAATELERFADCSSAWLFERVIDPKTIDAEADAMLRGKIAHQALYTFYSGLPKELGSDRVTSENLEGALRFVERCLDEALRGGVRLDLSDVESAELREGLLLDLERFLQEEADSPLGLLPRRFEVGFGNDRSAPELQRGIELGNGLFASGKIDRIDVDPFSARGIMQDYKSGKGAFSARQIDDERRLQVPLYMLALRDLVGIEPLGGVYRALSGSRGARGMLREEARDDLPGFSAKDYLDEETFWAQVETARTRAYEYAERMRAGDVLHDPKGGECPAWCDLWTMCRVRHA